MLVGGVVSRPVICCVLRAGGDFSPLHVAWLHRQCQEHMPDWDFMCWSDIPVVNSVPLVTDWPRWWAKFEIYAPESPIAGRNALIIDLDTVFLGPVHIKPEHQAHAIFIRDPYRDGCRGPERLGNGFTYTSPEFRRIVWDVWTQLGPARLMRVANDDDQWLFTTIAHNGPATVGVYRWQDEYPDQVVSYKAHTRGLGILPQNRVVYFHGKPRPWDLNLPWIPEL